MDEFHKILKHLEKLIKAMERESDFSDTPIPDFCSGMSCMGTPAEIASLIKAGYGCTLLPMRVTVVTGNGKGDIASKEIPIMQVANDRNGCVMHKNGKCLLWELGLTPMMGKQHLLKDGKLGTKTKKGLFHSTVLEWLDPNNASDIRFCLKSMEENYKNLDSNPTN